MKFALIPLLLFLTCCTAENRRQKAWNYTAGYRSALLQPAFTIKKCWDEFREKCTEYGVAFSLRKNDFTAGFNDARSGKKSAVRTKAYLRAIEKLLLKRHGR